MSRFCDYSDVYILVKGTATVPNTGGNNTNNSNEKVIIKNCASFSDCMTEINNTQVDNSKGIVLVMSVYNLMEYSNNYSKKSGSLWQHYRDESALNAAGVIDFRDADNSVLFQFKQKITGETGNDGMKDVEITVPL